MQDGYEFIKNKSRINSTEANYLPKLEKKKWKKKETKIFYKGTKFLLRVCL